MGVAEPAADVRGRAGDQERPGVHRRPAGPLQGGRCRHRQAAVEVPDRLRASTPRRSPTSSTASSMWRSCPASAAIRRFYFSGPKGGMLWVFAIDGKVADTTSFNASDHRERPCRSMASNRALGPRLAAAAALVTPCAAASAEEAMINPVLGDPSAIAAAAKPTAALLHLPPEPRRARPQPFRSQAERRGSS